jgi:hypothetical protein
MTRSHLHPRIAQESARPVVEGRNCGLPIAVAFLVAVGCVSKPPAVMPEPVPVSAPVAPVVRFGSKPAEEATTSSEQTPKAFPPRPTLAAGEEFDWIRLKSGEWLKGELSQMSDKSLDFDSKELDELKIDLEDVVEFITPRNFSILLPHRVTVVGVPWIVDKRVTLQTATGEMRFPLSDVVAFTHGGPTESNYWSGKLRLSGTVRSGNTDQIDSVLSIKTVRRTADTRLSLSLDSVTGSSNGSENINNQSFDGTKDIFISRKLFWTPLGVNLFRDRFQNIDLRVVPRSGFGYGFIDNADSELDVTLAIGYRFERYDSVAAGEPTENTTAILDLGTTLAHDIGKNVELGLSYTAQIGLEDVEDTNQDASLDLSFDFFGNFDFDVRLVWTHIGQPAADANGDFPTQDDFRMDVGIAWEF